MNTSLFVGAGASVFVIGWLLVLQLIDQSAHKLLRDSFRYARRQVLEKFLEGGRRARVTQHADRLDCAKQNLWRRFFKRVGERLQHLVVTLAYGREHSKRRP